MITFRKFFYLGKSNAQVIQDLKQSLKAWIQKEIIDDDPYDELTLEEASLMTRLSLRRLLELKELASRKIY